MPFVIPGGRRRRLTAVAAALAAAALAAVPAAASAAPAASTGCTPDALVSTPFAPWNDANAYVMAPGGSFEGASGWSGAGAVVVADQEPWKIAGAGHGQALRIPNGGYATSAAACLDPTFPTFRFFARNTGNLKGTLHVEAAYRDTRGRVQTVGAGDVKATAAGWFLANPLKIDVKYGTEMNASAPVVFVLESMGGSDWRIDDVAIDPFARR
jgi:hypothetical protein